MDPCPWFKGQACQQLFLSTPADCKRPDLWRANQRQLAVWIHEVPAWTFRDIVSFDSGPYTNARILMGFRWPLRVHAAQYRKQWETVWCEASVAAHLASVRPRKSWDADLKEFYERIDNQSMGLANAAREYAEYQEASQQRESVLAGLDSETLARLTRMASRRR